MNNTEEIIFLIDDDPSIRRSISLFLTAANYHVETFESSEEYLARDRFEGTGCILLDINLDGKSGFDLQNELISQDSLLPIIFITGFGNIPMSVQALKQGALNFLEKPFKEDELLHSIEEGLVISRKLFAEHDEIEKARNLIRRLSPRENEILKYLLTGMLNKQIASELDIAENTVKNHRQSICEKLEVKSVPEILRIADKAALIHTSVKE